MSLTVIVYDDVLRANFRPLSETRPLADLRCGCFTARERVERLLDEPVSMWVAPAIADVVRAQAGCAVNAPLNGPTLLLNGRGLWRGLPESLGREAWVGLDERGDVACVYTGNEWGHPFMNPGAPGHAPWDEAVREAFLWRDVSSLVRLVRWPWEIITANARQLAEDAPLHPAPLVGQSRPGVHFIEPANIRVAPTARLMPGVVIDAEAGPVVIDEGVRILPHTYVQGPAYIGPNCLIQAGAVLRGGVSLGPVCKVGGEVEGSIIQGFSNKQHDGFLGHSYVGSWVNIAADCINSDLKNTYGTIRMPIGGEPIETGERFLGMLVGDHAKIGINCAIPTGAVIGVGTSIVGPQAPIYTGSLEWVENTRRVPYELDRARDVARRVVARRGQTFTAADEELFARLHEENWGRETARERALAAG